MSAPYHIRRYLATLESAGKPEAVAERAARNKAAKLAIADRKAKFPDVTRGNFEEASTYQQERFDYHYAKSEGTS